MTCRGLGHRFGARPLLFHGLDLELSPGVLYGLVGPSGSGKSTLMSILAGGLRPSEGSIELDGVRRIGWVMQNPIGAARRTALDQVVLPLLARGIPRSDAEPRAAGLLARFGLAEVAASEFRRLSGGEAQRLCLARASASDYDALLIDEPTAQLDRDTAATIGDVIRETVSSERIVVLATHDPHLRSTCDDIIDLGSAP